MGAKRRHYLVSVIDACTRLAWAEVVDDLKSLSVMFAALKSINLLNAEYGVPVRGYPHGQRGRGGLAGQQGGPPDGADVPGAGHHAPLHAALPAADQREDRTVLRTLNEDLLDETTFESVEELQRELVEYLLYYNTERPHQGLGGKSPLQTLQNLSTN